MAHIHDKIDFVITVYIVHDNKVLLVDHKKIKAWLGVGGHIELDEDSDQALFREVEEECGLEIEVLAEKPLLDSPGTKPLLRPHYLDIHPYSVDTDPSLDESKHRHLNLVYFAKAKSSAAKLEKSAHNDIRWFSDADLDDPKWNIPKSVAWYAKEALKAAKD